MAASISLSFRVSLVLLLLCAAWSAQAAGQADTTSPANHPAPTRHDAQKDAPVGKRASHPPNAAASGGPAEIVQKHFDAARAAERQGDFIRSENEYRQVLGLALQEKRDAYNTHSDLENADAAAQEA